MKKNKQNITFTCFWVASLAIVLRLAFCFGVSNYDMESYLIVSKLALSGANIYEETSRYNYGFFWAAVLAFSRWAAGLSEQLFRVYIVLILSVVDIFLSALLYKRYGAKTGLICLFFPTSILLTGFHSQMDNWAILWAYCGWIILRQKQGENWLLSALLLGFSLVQKHIFIFFPFWLGFSDLISGWRRKIMYSFIAYGIFLCSFLPFFGSQAAAEGIFKNVFGYNSAEGIATFPYFIKTISADLHAYLIDLQGYKYLFISSLLALGYYCRQAKNELFYLYLVAVVALSSALANQYLAIPIVAICIKRNYLTWAFAAVSTAFLVLRSPAHLGILPFFQQIFNSLPFREWWQILFSLYACQFLLLIILCQRILNIKKSPFAASKKA